MVGGFSDLSYCSTGPSLSVVRRPGPGEVRRVKKTESDKNWVPVINLSSRPSPSGELMKPTLEGLM